MRFRSGHFLGAFAARRAIGPMTLAELRPTVPEHEVVRHMHDDAHVLLLIEGAYVSSARGMPDVCAHPVLILNPPGTEHRDRFRGLDGRFLTLSLPLATWQSLTNDIGVGDAAIRLPVPVLAEGVRCLRALRDWDAASPLAIETALAGVLGAAAAQRDCIDAAAPAWLQRAEQRLADLPQSPPTLAELARIADVHPVHFARAFRKRHGCAPSDYLRERQFERALARLAAGALPIEAAADAGYVDQSHLHRWCRRWLRDTPGRVRALLAAHDVAGVQDAPGALD